MNNRQINKLHNKAKKLMSLPWLHFIEEGLIVNSWHGKKDWRSWNFDLNYLLKIHKRDVDQIKSEKAWKQTSIMH